MGRVCSDSLSLKTERIQKESERQRLEAEIEVEEERSEKALNAAMAKREELAKLNDKQPVKEGKLPSLTFLSEL